MQADARQLTFLGYEVFHPQHAKFEGNEIAEFYALVHDSYPLETCVHHGDAGGTFETEGWLEVEVERDTFKYSETIRDDISAVKARAGGMFALAKAHFHIPFFFISSVGLRQLWHVPEVPDMSVHLRERGLKITEDQFEALGENVAGAGIQVTGDRDVFHWHIDLEPYYRQEGTLWVDFRAYGFPPGDPGEPDDDPLGKALDLAHGFLDDNVTKFVMGFLA